MKPFPYKTKTTRRKNIIRTTAVALSCIMITNDADEDAIEATSTLGLSEQKNRRKRTHVEMRFGSA